MKKLLCSLGIFALLTLMASSVSAIEIGDPMPDPRTMSGIEKSFTHVAWYFNDGTHGGYIQGYRNISDMEPRFYVGEQHCNGAPTKYPIGVYDVEKDTLYIDNVPRDGKIDSITVAPHDKRVQDDAVKCDQLSSIESWAVHIVNDIRRVHSWE